MLTSTPITTLTLGLIRCQTLLSTYVLVSLEHAYYYRCLMLSQIHCCKNAKLTNTLHSVQSLLLLQNDTMRILCLSLMLIAVLVHQYIHTCELIILFQCSAVAVGWCRISEEGLRHHQCSVADHHSCRCHLLDLPANQSLFVSLMAVRQLHCVYSYSLAGHS